MEMLKQIPYLFLVLAISGIVAGAALLSVQKFNDTTTDADTSAALQNVTAGMKTVAEQFPTIGIIAVMAIIIGVLSSVFVYLAYFR